MPLHAQYLVNLCEICTTKRSWKDLHTEGIKLNPPYMRLDLPPLQLLKHFPFVILGSS